MQGICEKTVQDIVERFWDIVEELSINRVLAVLKDNLVGAVLIVSIILWIPASCVISWVSSIILSEAFQAKVSSFFPFKNVF